VEFQDGDFVVYSEDGSSTGSWLERWNIDFSDAADKGGRTVRPGLILEKIVRDAGFEDIHHEKVRLPVGLWPKDKQLVSCHASFVYRLYSTPYHDIYFDDLFSNRRKSEPSTTFSSRRDLRVSRLRFIPVS